MSDDRDGEQGKRSWRDIDRRRDRGRAESHAGEGSGRRPRSAQQTQAYRAYKTQLNKLFSGDGSLPDALRGKLADAGGVGQKAAERKERLQTLRTAATPGALRDALAEFRQHHGFPDDPEVLGKLLDASDEAVVLEAIDTIGRLQQAGTLKRTAALKVRLKTVLITMDDGAIQAAAKAVLSKLDK